ncbi:predicted protein [Uncinocarpus reesii 1704]|uniref:Uncharacterized protein n=1 Tax=Uncinocarpus reesii (strain UAMH 1704) TaxID=336963 RepID=C4JY91_UNCRE|nr:uncharacterized protein UREG_07142 [Uncinocarpus reesii 1704]EEP82277.1 predicted protein [Uncinocarpus reesii 1704]
MASEWWDNFSNNLATDLAPLIALFGEAPTKQYLSECLDTTDIILFAIAPLGIITAIISAIRVCGTAALRAFIGRAQEGGGAAEAELCTSTSREVCELYNNGGVARVFGRPKLLEIVHDKHASGEDFYRHSSRPATAGIYLFKDYIKLDGQEWKELTKTRLRFRSVEDGKLISSSKSATPQLRFAPNPNLSLNVGIKQHRKSVFVVATVMGLFMQSAVIIWAGIARYRLQFVKGDLQDTYAVPIVLIGTILLCAGIGWCALLVERSTSERIFERERGGDPRSQLYWVQPGTQFVGDQAFDSFAYTHPKNEFSRYITSWKENQEESRLELWAAIALSLGGFILQFLGLRACHSSVAVAQLGVTILMSLARSMLRTDRLKKEEIFLADQPEFYEGHELDWLSLNIGNIHQRKLNWQISSSRRHLPTRDSEERYEDTALRKMVIADEKKCVLTGFRPDHSLRANSSPKTPLRTAALDRGGDTAEDYWSSEKWRFEAHRDSKELGKQGSHLPSDIAKVYSYRCRLSHLTSNWEERLVSVRDIASSLARAIEATTKVLFTSDVVFKEGWEEAFTLFWPVPCEMISITESTPHNGKSNPILNPDIGLRATQGTVYLSLRRGLDVDGRAKGEWRVDDSELEAVLGLWRWSLKEADKDVDPITTPRRILGGKIDSSGSNAITDFDLWREGKSGFSIMETLNPPRESYGRRIFGWHNVPVSNGADITGDVTVLELPLTTRSLPTMFAQELYSLFFASILQSIEDIGGKTEVKQSQSLCFTNSNISRIQASFTESGLGPIEDAFTCIMPAIRNQGKLPTAVGNLPAVRSTAESYLAQENWEEAEKLLRWASPHIHAPDNGSEEGIGLSSTINQQRLLTLDLCECYRKALTSATAPDFGWKGIVEILQNSTNDGRDKITLDTVGDQSSYTLAQTIRCYAQAALRIAQDNNNEQASKELAAGIQSSLVNPDPKTEIMTIKPVKPGKTMSKSNDKQERLLSEAIKRGDLRSALYYLHRPSVLEERDPMNRSALSLAAGRGWYIVVKDMLKRGAILEEKDKNARSAISYAAENGDLNTFEYLLNQGAFSNFPDHTRRTPLSYAAQNGHTEVARLLLYDLRVEADPRDGKGQTPLLYAVKNGSNEIVKLLMKKGVDVNLKGQLGQTPLAIAVDSENEQLVATLLANERVDVDIKDRNGNTPLLLAVVKGNDKLVELILTRQEVDINTKNQQGMTPLTYAADAGYDKIVSLLLSKGNIRVNLQNKNIESPLFLAARKGHVPVVRQLLARDDVALDLFNKNVQSPLSEAAAEGQSEAVALLLKHDFKTVDEYDINGQSPLSRAAMNGRTDTVAQFLAMGDKVDVNSGAIAGWTPLCWAAIKGHTDVVQLLLSDKRVIVDMRANNGQTPLSMAAEKGFVRSVEILLATEGVDPNASDGEQMTPVAWAARRGHGRERSISYAEISAYHKLATRFQRVA